MIVFDIETKPHFNKEWIDGFKKPFNEDDVALGNTKDPIKIADKIESSREKHESNFYKKALLKAELSQVFALTILKPVEIELFYNVKADKTAKIEIEGVPLEILIWLNDAEGEDRESDIVREFFGLYSQIQDAYFTRADLTAKMVGHNIEGFDLPYLQRKGWYFRLPNAKDLIVGHNWNPVFEDTMKVWREGMRDRESDVGYYISLNSLSKFLRTGEKEDIGEFIYSIYQNDPDRALKYMANDVVLPYKNYKIMKGIE